MKRDPENDVAEEVADLRQRIAEWRLTRKRFSPMPEELWSAAVALARKHGIYSIARKLGVAHAGLKLRVVRGDDGDQAEEPSSGGFVPLVTSRLFDSTGVSGSVIELSSADGCRLTIRLSAGNQLDVLSLVKALWRPH